AHGPDPGARARLRPGPAGARTPAGRLHLLQPDAGPHRPDHLGLRRGEARGDPGDPLGPVGGLPGHAAGGRRYRVHRGGRRCVDAVYDEGPGLISVVMSAHGKPVTAEAGQFFTFRFLGAPGWTRAHPYSLSAATDGRRLRVTVNTGGDGGAALRRVRPGSAVLI